MKIDAKLVRCFHRIILISWMGALGLQLTNLVILPLGSSGLRVVDLFFMIFMLFFLKSKFVVKCFTLVFCPIIIASLMNGDAIFVTFRYLQLYVISIGVAWLLSQIPATRSPRIFNIIGVMLLVLGILSNTRMGTEILHLNPCYSSIMMAFFLLFAINKRKFNLGFGIAFSIMFQSIRGVMLVLYIYSNIKYLRRIKLILVLNLLFLVAILGAYMFSSQTQSKVDDWHQNGISQSGTSLIRLAMVNNGLAMVKSMSLPDLCFGYGMNYTKKLEDVSNVFGFEGYGNNTFKIRIHNEPLALFLSFGICGLISYVGVLLLSYRFRRYNSLVWEYYLIFYGAFLFNTFFFIGSNLMAWYFFPLSLLMADTLSYRRRSFGNQLMDVGNEKQL